MGSSLKNDMSLVKQTKTKQNSTGKTREMEQAQATGQETDTGKKTLKLLLTKKNYNKEMRKGRNIATQAQWTHLVEKIYTAEKKTHHMRL